MRKIAQILVAFSEKLNFISEVSNFFQTCYSLLKGTLKDNLPTRSEVLEIYGKIIVNGLKILDGNMTNVGHGLYIGTSILDHSCTPNAQWHHRSGFFFYQIIRLT